MPQTGGQDELSQALKAARLTAGLGSTRKAEEATGVSQSQISRAESGKTLPSDELLGKLLDGYRVKQRDRARLERMAADVRAGTRRIVFSRRNRAAVQDEIGRAQRQARLVRGFTAIGIPGSLQTEDYALNIMSARKGRTPEAEAAAAARMTNQNALHDVDHPRRWHYVVAEGALSWPAGGPLVMAQQIDHLVEMTRRPNLRLGVVPFGAWEPALSIPLNGWEMYDDRMVHYGTITMSVKLDQAAEVARYAAMFNQLAELAVYDEPAREALRGVADRYRRLPCGS